MPSTLTYPGVYIEEIPSGTRTMTGVATSVTAFLGRTQRGTTNQPVLVNSFRDYERLFGGLWLNSSVSYAINDFFRNGGSQAVVVRLYHGVAVNDVMPSGTGKFVVGNLELWAKDPGAWANNLLVAVDYTDRTSDLNKEVASSLGVTYEDLFNLTVTYFAKSGTTVERYINLTVADTPRRVDRVLQQASKFIGVAAGFTLADSIPAETKADATTGEVGVHASSGTALDSAALVDADYNFDVLDRTDNLNLVCVPADTRGGDTTTAVYSNALAYCYKRRAILIVDPPAAWSSKDAAAISVSDLKLSGQSARNAAVYYPRVRLSDPLRNGRIEEFPPCGLVAGVISRTDVQRGVWKAPAGIDASLAGVDSLTVKLTDSDSGMLNPQGINCLRSFPAAGQVIWGARTLRGADALGDEYKYLSVRRLALYLEESVYRGTQWVVFEPNDEPLWAQIRLNVGAFMQGLFRQGAFQGKTPREAYFVKCDKESTTAGDIDAGIVNIVIGFAPLKPAEFVVIKFQQLAGQNSA